MLDSAPGGGGGGVRLEKESDVGKMLAGVRQLGGEGAVCCFISGAREKIHASFDSLTNSFI